MPHVSTESRPSIGGTLAGKLSKFCLFGLDECLTVEGRELGYQISQNYGIEPPTDAILVERFVDRPPKGQQRFLPSLKMERVVLARVPSRSRAGRLIQRLWSQHERLRWWEGAARSQFIIFHPGIHQFLKDVLCPRVLHLLASGLQLRICRLCQLSASNLCVRLPKETEEPCKRPERRSKTSDH